ncbi:MAG: DUF6525 family protein [Pseudomonadota bacterium]
MTRNLGETRLKRRRRACDPMQSFDALPAPVRGWLAEAALPWSPTSARRIWESACARGLSEPDALAVLSDAERRLLSKDHERSEAGRA